MGVVVRRYIDFLIVLLIPTPLVLALFCSSISTSLFIFRSLYIITDLYRNNILPGILLCASLEKCGTI